MKVLQINAVYNIGSTGVIVKNIHELCLKNGIDSYVAYSTSPVPNNEIHNGYKIGGFWGKKLHALFCRINGKQAYFSRWSTFRLIRYIEKISPDIIHLHNLHSNYVHLNLLLDYVAKKRIPTIITLHDSWFYTGGCFAYIADNCYKWLDSCGTCPKKTKDTPAYLCDFSKQILAARNEHFSRIDKLYVVGVSNWIANEARRSFLKNRCIKTIYNGIDTDFFVPTASDLREKFGLQDKFVILGPASKWLKPINKPTFDFFVSKLPEDCSFVLLGCTEKQKKLLPSSVMPVDFIYDRKELRKVYSMADVFVNCTREDTLSLINLEVQSCGTPVITYDNTGVRETVDNICGFTVNTGDYEGLFNTTLSVKQKGKNTFSKACQKWVLSMFNDSKNYIKYVELYKSILNL